MVNGWLTEPDGERAGGNPKGRALRVVKDIIIAGRVVGAMALVAASD
jgi:hypothetical protein